MKVPTVPRESDTPETEVRPSFDCSSEIQGELGYNPEKYNDMYSMYRLNLARGGREPTNSTYIP